MKTLKFLVLAAVAGWTLQAMPAQADLLSDIKAAKKIRISTDLTISPYGKVDDKMQPSGSDVEIGKLLAKDLGVELELVATTASTRIPNLQTGKADITISSLAITPARAEVVDFSVPYADQLSVIAGPKGINAKSIDDLEGKKVAVTRSTTQDSDLTARAKKSQIVRYEDDATLSLAIASGQADLFGTAFAQIATINAKNPSRELEAKFTLQTFLLGIGVRKGEPELLAWLNSWVKENLRNGKLGAIHKTFHGIDLAPETVKAGFN